MWAGSNRQSSDYSFSAGSSQNFRNNDSYDFDISGDGDDYSFSSPEQKPRQSMHRSGSFNARMPTASSNVYSTSANNNGGYGSGTLRRTSIEDRAKEILEKARATAPKVTDDDVDDRPSLQATFAELLEGIDIPKGSKQDANIDVDITSPKVNLGGTKKGVDTIGDTSYGDSFELSAADLEIGTIAAKRLREKSAERGRRMSFDQPNFREQKELSTFAKKSAASPDPAKSRKSLGDFQISTALSSIQRSKSFTGDMGHHGSGDFAKYGSMERSDDEIYKMLNVTGAQDSMVASRSFLNSSANSSFIHHAPNQGIGKQITPTVNDSSHNAPLANNLTDNNTLNNHNDSFNSNESYRSDEFHDSREELLNSPIPHLQRQQAVARIESKENHVVNNEVEEEDGYYDDDFETDINASAIDVLNKNDIANNSADNTSLHPPAANVVTNVVVNTPRSVSESPKPSKQAGENLNSVDEILQRWYNADTHTLMRSLDDIGRSRSQSTDLKPSNATNSKIDSNPSIVTNGLPISRSSSASPFLPLAPSEILPVSNDLNTNFSVNTAVIIPRNTPTSSSHASSLVDNATTATDSNDNYNNLDQNIAVTGIAMGSKPSSNIVEVSPNVKESNANSASSALEIPTWDEAELLAMQNQYADNDSKNDDGETSADHENQIEPFSEDINQLPESSSIKVNMVTNITGNRNKPLQNEDNNSFDLRSQHSKRSGRYDDPAKQNSAKANTFSDSNKNAKHSPSSVSDSNSNHSDSDKSPAEDSRSQIKSNEKYHRRKSLEENTIENIEEESEIEDLKHYRRNSLSRSLSPTRKHRSVANTYNNNLSTNSTMPVSIPRHPTHIPRLASSTKAKLIAKQQNQQKDHGNDTEFQQLKKQNSQVLRKVFQLQDQLLTLRRSQSLDRNHANHSVSSSNGSLRQSHQSHLSLSDVYHLSKNYEGKHLVPTNKTVKVSRSLSPSANLPGISTGHSFNRNKEIRNDADKMVSDVLNLLSNDNIKSNHDIDFDNKDNTIKNNNIPETISSHSMAQELETIRFAVSAPLPDEADTEWFELKKILLSKASVLHKKEKELSTREKILAMKEASLLQRELLLETRDTQDMEAKLTGPLKSALSKIEHLENENDELKRQHAILNEELLSVKQRKFNNNDHGDNIVAKMTLEDKQQNDMRRQLALQALQRLCISMKPHVSTNKNKQSNTKNNENSTNQIGTTTEDSLTLNRADYEALLKDYSAQDALLNGFQKENEKLVKQLQEKHKELQQIQAQFFDERDTLNKELNSLRQFIPNVASQTQNRHNLQQSLNDECRIRDLTDQNQQLTKEIIELRKTSLQTQDNLRQEIQNLQQDLQLLQPEKFVLLKRSLMEKEAENMELTKRLERMAVVCEKTSHLEEKSGILRSQVSLLKQEILRRQVMTSTQLQRLMKQAEELPFHQLLDLEQQLEKQVDSSTFVALNVNENVSTNQRNFSDVRRIKELERTVRELQEALRKRFPDSVASLIHVNKVDDIQSQRETARLKLIIKELQEELEEQIHSSELRVAQLRTQQDALKTHYETQLRKLQQELQIRTNSSSIKGDEEESNNTKTIREFELELKRSRSFYQRKIMELQRKFDIQLRAVKRGDNNAVFENNNIPSNYKSSAPDDSRDTSGSHDICEEDSETDNSRHSPQKQFEERLSLLQKELFLTTDELGRLKAENNDLLSQLKHLQQLPQIIDSKQATNSDIETLFERKLHDLKLSLQEAHMEEMKRQHDAQNETIMNLRLSLDRLQQRRVESPVVSSTKTNTENCVDDNDLVKDLRSNILTLEGELKNERQRCSALTTALLTLNQQQSSKNSKNSCIEVLTNETLLLRQIEDLQRRFTLREQELTAVTQHIRTQHALEMQRNQQLHEQEIRAKDEQLTRFRLELTQTVTHLHNLQQQHQQQQQLKLTNDSNEEHSYSKLGRQKNLNTNTREKIK